MIDFKNVTKTYNKSNVGLEDVTVHIDKGEFVFLVGPSGAGKSTFIKLMLKEIDVDSGEIVVDGYKVNRLSNREVPKYRRNIGTVFQDFRLLDKKTVYENVAFAMEILHKKPHIIRKQVPQVLTLVGLRNKENKYPAELSAGEQQRIAIARAIANNPRVLIADEPTGNLDPITADEIMELLKEINDRGTTILMVTHAKDIVDKMNRRVIAIETGKIVRDEKKGQYDLKKVTESRHYRRAEHEAYESAEPESYRRAEHEAYESAEPENYRRAEHEAYESAEPESYRRAEHEAYESAESESYHDQREAADND